MDSFCSSRRPADFGQQLRAVARLRSGSRQNLPTARAISAGGIVVRRTEQGLELILGKRRRERDGVSWSLPKGTPEGAETIEETALREVCEETGLEVRILATVGPPIRYHFVQSGLLIHKTVYYFLMAPTGGDLGQHDHEFDEVRWFGAAEAEAIMSFQSEREIMVRALGLSEAA